MDKVIVICESQFLNLFNPVIQRLDNIESLLSQKFSIVNSTYSDGEAARNLNMSTKKLQHLRNARKIGFIR